MVGREPPYYAAQVPWWPYYPSLLCRVIHPGYTTSLPVPLLSVHHLPLTLRCPLTMLWAQQ